MIRIGLLGAEGRMGLWVRKLIETEFAEKCTLAITADRTDSLEALVNDDSLDVVIDFSTSETMAALAGIAVKRTKNGDKLPGFVIGSTGWSPSQLEEIEELGKVAPVLLASNFSTGVLVLTQILKEASPILRKFGYTPVLVETHHRHKKDAPSGTALSLAHAIAPDNREAVQTHSIRAGEVIGDHEVTFYGPGDHISFGHFAQDRSIFARGAIEVALWIASRPRRAQGVMSLSEYFADISREQVK